MTCRLTRAQSRASHSLSKPSHPLRIGHNVWTCGPQPCCQGSGQAYRCTSTHRKVLPSLGLNLARHNLARHNLARVVPARFCHSPRLSVAALQHPECAISCHTVDPFDPFRKAVLCVKCRWSAQGMLETRLGTECSAVRSLQTSAAAAVWSFVCCHVACTSPHCTELL